MPGVGFLWKKFKLKGKGEVHENSDLNLRVDRHSTNQEVYSQDMANTTGLFECSRKGFAAAKPLSGYEPKLLTLCCSALRHGSGSIKVMR